MVIAVEGHEGKHREAGCAPNPWCRHRQRPEIIDHSA